MKIRQKTLPIILIFVLCGFAFGQIKGAKLPIINGRATFLSKPVYPQAAKDFCVGGKVEVEVLIDEKGNVIEAKAISGDELLRESAVEAVKKAKFSQPMTDAPIVKTRGIIVYNFIVENKCSETKNVNKTAGLSKPRTYSFCVINGKPIHLPQPKYPQIAKAVKAAGEVQVQVL